MRLPDYNRVRKAQDHLAAAVTALNAIKWENIGNFEYEMRAKAIDDIRAAYSRLEDMINANKQ